MSDKPTEERTGAAGGRKIPPRGLRLGDFVVHMTCHTWGIGKIIAGREGRNVTILFEDGREKIISRDYHSVLRTVPRPPDFAPPVLVASPQPSPRGKKVAKQVPADGEF